MDEQIVWICWIWLFSSMCECHLMKKLYAYCNQWMNAYVLIHIDCIVFAVCIHEQVFLLYMYGYMEI